MLTGPAATPPPFQTVTEALAQAARTSRGLTFVDLREEEGTLSYAELRARAGRVAGSLVERGVAPGDRVAIVLPTGPSFMDAFFGALLAGAVPVPLYPPVRLGRLTEYHAATARMLTRAGARLVLTDARIQRLLGQALERARPALGCAEVEPLLEGPFTERRTAPDALALLQFSSGSTRHPKPVALDHRNLLAQCAALHRELELTPGTSHRGVSWLPLYHDMGLIGFLLMGVYLAGPVTLLPPDAFLARPALWLRAISRHGATVSAAPSFAYALCLKRVKEEQLEGVDLSGWQVALNGAEPVSAGVMRRFAERFAPHGFDPRALRPVYGLAEASLAVTFTPRREQPRIEEVDPLALARRGEVEPGPRALVSVGRPVEGVALKVTDALGRELPEGRVGHLKVRGPSVMRGYFEDPEATRAALDDGWLDTGDLGFCADGELFLCGRAKDLVIIRGANHAPQEFEDVVNTLEGVRVGCVVALGFTPPGGEGEVLLLLAERNALSSPGLEARIADAVAAQTGIRPHAVVLLAPGTLPRTSSGKLRRREALARYLDGTLTPPAKVTALTLGAELLKSALALARSRRVVDR